MKSRAQRKFALGVLIGAAFGCMTLVAVGVIVFLYFLFGGPAEVTRDVFQYEYLIGRTDAVQEGRGGQAGMLP
ncbi:MAG: hypothetical protein J6M66_01370 [Lachnospiraceae bacterium]|nr:hypothetical protein [Lachnospiraceae bacterium]